MNSTSVAAVSVVLAIHRDSQALTLSIKSVLSQTDIELEIIVVGDGDPTGVEERLAKFNDARIVYLPIPRTGLTGGLLKGCERASHPLIARLDVGDLMLPNRLAKQAREFSRSGKIVLVSSNFGFYTDEGYYLYSTEYKTEALRQSLKNADSAGFTSPMHASVMFRRDVYQQVGGYRSEFYLAQDCDLWLRMLNVGELVNLDEELSIGVFSISGLSARFKPQQDEYKRLIVEMRDLGKKGLDTEGLLRRADDLSSQLREKELLVQHAPLDSKAERIAFCYFVARCLMPRNTEGSDLYFRQLLKLNPIHLKAWIFYLFNRLKPTRKCDRTLKFGSVFDEDNDGGSYAS